MKVFSDEVYEAFWEGFCKGSLYAMAAWGLIMILAVGLGILVFPSKACAQERYSDPDKKLHFAAGALIATGTTMYTKSAATGAMAGCLVGVLKEEYDRRNPPHVATRKDVIATCAGAMVGAGAGWAVTPGAVVWQVRF